MISFLKRYRHAFLLFAYACIYAPWFIYLERTVTKHYHLIHMKLDDYIPFQEFFIIPYFLWFAYVSIVVFYLLFTNKTDYYKNCAFLFIGMTIFLIISTVYPNGHHLRPVHFERDNIFTHMVASLYRTDTATNLFPSIHVYNSLGTHFAVCNNEKLYRHKWIRYGSLILCISIILSTVFLKQHSVFDVITAFVMATILYILVYAIDYSVIGERRRAKESLS